MTRHDRLVRAMAAVLRMQGYEVSADLPGWTRPKKIGHFVPDIAAVSVGNRTRIIAEIEDEFSLFVPHSVMQIRQMAAIASAGPVMCYLVVPRCSAPLGKFLLGQLGFRRVVRLAWVSPWRGGYYG